MRCVYWLLSIGACVGTGLLGLAAGINLNPDSTVKFVPVLDANAWSAVGSWLGAIATFCAAGLALKYSRRDDKQKLKLSSFGQVFFENHEKEDYKLTLRAVCIGRLPATVIDVGFGVCGDDHAYYSIGSCAPATYSRMHISRGEVYEVTLGLDDLLGIGRAIPECARRSPQNLEFVVKTGVRAERRKLSPEAAEVLSKLFTKFSWN